jgi:hypothetical protein
VRVSEREREEEGGRGREREGKQQTYIKPAEPNIIQIGS